MSDIVTKARQVARRLDGRPVTSRIKTFDDVLFDLSEEDSDVVDYRNLLAVFNTDHHLVNHQKCILIAKSLNEGWTPNWSDSSQNKYNPYFEMQGSSGFRFDDRVNWHTHSNIGFRLCFKTEELAKYAGTQFQPVYEKAMILINK